MEEGAYTLACKGSYQQGDIHCDLTHFSTRDAQRMKVRHTAFGVGWRPGV
jgi:hypothetical protein